MNSSSINNTVCIVLYILYSVCILVTEQCVLKKQDSVYYIQNLLMKQHSVYKNNIVRTPVQGYKTGMASFRTPNFDRRFYLASLLHWTADSACNQNTSHRTLFSVSFFR